MTKLWDLMSETCIWWFTHRKDVRILIFHMIMKLEALKLDAYNPSRCSIPTLHGRVLMQTDSYPNPRIHNPPNLARRRYS